MNEVYQTGKYPALTGAEYCKCSGTCTSSSAPDAMQWSSKNPYLITPWNNGGIIRVMSHFQNPTNINYEGLGDISPNIKEILTNGTLEHTRWLSL